MQENYLQLLFKNFFFKKKFASNVERDVSESNS